MIMVTVFFLIMVLAPSGFAEKTVKTKYLEFSSQKEKPVNLASDYATLKSPSTGELPIHGFTICGSIQIHYFQGIQAFYTVRQNVPTKRCIFTIKISLKSTTALSLPTMAVRSTQTLKLNLASGLTPGPMPALPSIGTLDLSLWL